MQMDACCGGTEGRWSELGVQRDDAVHAMDVAEGVSGLRVQRRVHACCGVQRWVARLGCRGQGHVRSRVSRGCRQE